MIEETLMQLLILSLYGDVILGIISIVLLVILTFIIIKNNRISADQ